MWFKLANLIMGGARFLGADADIESGAADVGKYIYNTIQAIMVPILAVVAAAGMIWAIVLGVNMARADSTEKREESKKRLIALIVGIIIMVVLILFFTVGLAPLLNAFGVKVDFSDYGTKTFINA